MAENAPPGGRPDYDFPWVTFRLGERLFGISACHVREMLVLPELTRLPAAVPHVRGVINLRGNVILVTDLRMQMDQKPLAAEVEELVELLNQREQDHLKWINELEASVKESREFKLTTDPHKCAFGRWYDTYKAHNVILENHLKRFDAPHKAIHALAVEVLELTGKGAREEALKRIEQTRNATLKLLVNLFAETKKLLRETLREIVIVLRHGDAALSVTVDTIESVEYLKEGSIEDIPLFMGGGTGHIVQRTGRSARNERLIMLVETGALFRAVPQEAFSGLPPVSDAAK